MLSHEEIYKEFCAWSPEYAARVIKWEPWGSVSIIIWLNNGMIYKAKRYYNDCKFTMQIVSEEDIKRKLG